MVSHGSELGGPGGKTSEKPISPQRMSCISLQGSMFNKFHEENASELPRVAAATRSCRYGTSYSELPRTSQSAQRSCTKQHDRLELKVDETTSKCTLKFVVCFVHFGT